MTSRPIPLALTALALLFLVRLSVDQAWVGFRAGQMVLVALPPLLAMGLSTAWTCSTRLARSTPTRTTSPATPPRVICSTDFPLQWLEIDDFEHHQSWRIDAVARRWEVPSHSHRADRRKHASRASVCRSCRNYKGFPVSSSSTESGWESRSDSCIELG